MTLTEEQIREFGTMFEEMMLETTGLIAPEPELLNDCDDGEVRSIRVYPDPVLRQETSEVVFGEDLRKLVADLAITLYSSSGIGLSAPQIGVSERVFLVDILNGSERKEGRPSSQLLVAVNPRLWIMPGPLEVGNEGCLSFPDVRVGVSRASQVVIKAYTHLGKPWAMACGALLARTIQHEYDHLNGKLLIDYLNKKSARNLTNWLRSRPAPRSQRCS